MVKRGRLIVIEGLDRSGKSTQCDLLVSSLAALSSSHDADMTTPTEKEDCVVLQKFPDRTTVIGGMIHTYLTSRTELDDRAIHLLFSANRWERAPTLLAHLEGSRAGGRVKTTKHVVLDRYLYSGIVFSTVKGLDPTWCASPDIGLPRPDLVLFLDVSEAVAAQRGGFGEERYERAETQRAVRTAFQELFAGDGRVKVVDAGGSVEAVRREIWAHVEALLSTEPGPLETF